MYPVLFWLGPIPVFAYGTSMALGFLWAVWWVKRSAKDQRLPPDTLADICLTSLLGGIAGARLLYVFTDLKYFLAYPLSIFKIWEGGLVFYGGLLAGVSTAVWKIRREGLSVWGVGDVLAPAIALAHAVGRIGCFLNGCCYGLASSAYGVVFPSHGDGVARLPTQLYEALALGALAWWLQRSVRRPHREGEVFFGYVGIYALWRFGIEFLRDDARGPMLLDRLSISQFISLGLLVWAGVMLKSLKSHKPS